MNRHKPAVARHRSNRLRAARRSVGEAVGRGGRQTRCQRRRTPEAWGRTRLNCTRWILRAGKASRRVASDMNYGSTEMCPLMPLSSASSGSYINPDHNPPARQLCPRKKAPPECLFPSSCLGQSCSHPRSAVAAPPTRGSRNQLRA
jgi:hypothetical protein